MACYSDDVIWIPYDREGRIHEEALEEQIKEYQGHGWKVEKPNKPIFPQPLPGDAKSVLDLRSTAILHLGSSPGWIWFYQDGVLVKFYHPAWS